MKPIDPIILKIPEEVQTAIKEKLMHKNFAWHFIPYISFDVLTPQFFQFFHDITRPEEIADKEIFLIIQPIIEFVETSLNIKVIKTHRIKANLMVRTSFIENDLKILLHKDIMDGDKVENLYRNWISMVYYVDDSDGDTVLLEDDKRTIFMKSAPVGGNLCIFNSEKWHRSTPPQLNQRRVIINFILEIIEI